MRHLLVGLFLGQFYLLFIIIMQILQRIISVEPISTLLYLAVLPQIVLMQRLCGAYTFIIQPNTFKSVWTRMEL